MEQQRLLLFFALGIVLILIWNAWQEDYGRHAQPAPEAAAPAETGAVPGAAPGEREAAAASQAPPGGSSETAASAGEIRVLTDLLDVRIDTRGGTLRQALLRRHPLPPAARQRAAVLRRIGTQRPG